MPGDAVLVDSMSKRVLPGGWDGGSGTTPGAGHRNGSPGGAQPTAPRPQPRRDPGLLTHLEVPPTQWPSSLGTGTVVFAGSLSEGRKALSKILTNISK